MNEHNSNDINTEVRRHPLGQAEKIGDGQVRLTFVREYAHPVERVWQAVTDPSETAKWWARSRRSLQPGASLTCSGSPAKTMDTAPRWTGGTALCSPVNHHTCSKSATKCAEPSASNSAPPRSGTPERHPLGLHQHHHRTRRNGLHEPVRLARPPGPPPGSPREKNHSVATLVERHAQGPMTAHTRRLVDAGERHAYESLRVGVHRVLRLSPN